MTFTRREFLTMVALFSLPLPRQVLSQQIYPEQPYSDPVIADAWMKAWLATPHAASTPLHVGRFADPMYYLLDPIEWIPNQGQDDVKKVVVPKGFVTDFASIPRAFWSILPTDGPYVYAAIVHDYLYWDQSEGRDVADKTLRYAMGDFHVSTSTIETIYAGVRVGGKFAWQDNAKLKEKGEKRILKLFPDKPTTSWDEWRAGDVFT